MCQIISCYKFVRNKEEKSREQIGLEKKFYKWKDIFYLAPTRMESPFVSSNLK
jgi:hypothetical protein